ncbi:DNA-binding LacI/PurR family transcriptional regulator [Microbacterium natoriense]|uniref:DNA-binding LacI/PurR family transcriptional regulator n=1 Tax=Microbacterium natoriense TaxID=284570 RepID=A0AAW8ESK1_9MICO|nr:substrate-binding domain-containing protein [Microbacterium natoriense]MDQ0646481.1 DNA-binding LacI/PurR family transcriptional regulator [Microbacterium natoriense]
MTAAARHDAILRELELRGSLQSSSLSARLGVASMTLWRDLVTLEERGLLVRVHGGAVSLAVAQQQARTEGGGVARVRPIATIGMIVPTIDYYFPEVIRGASQAAGELNCRLVVGATNYSPDEELRQAERLIAAGVDALMVTPHDAILEASPLQRLLERADIPVVMVERFVDESVAGRLEWVRTDHAYGAELAVRHLAANGHEGIALAARPSATAAGLDVGYRKAVADLGLPLERQLRCELPDPQGGRGISMGALRQLLDDCLEARITAAVLLGDADAMAFTDLVLERGLRIPDDFAIMAYDDEVAAFAAVSLSAIAPPKHELGHAALRLCFDRLRQVPDAAHTVVRMSLLPGLVVRESTVRSI